MPSPHIRVKVVGVKGVVIGAEDDIEPATQPITGGAQEGCLGPIASPIASKPNAPTVFENEPGDVDGIRRCVLAHAFDDPAGRPHSAAGEAFVMFDPGDLATQNARRCGLQGVLLPQIQTHRHFTRRRYRRHTGHRQSGQSGLVPDVTDIRMLVILEKGNDRLGSVQCRAARIRVADGATRFPAAYKIRGGIQFERC